MAIVVRDEQPGDDQTIRALVTAAFGQPDEADLVDRLRADGDAVLSLVAIEREELVGHILFCSLDAPVRALGLAPLAVRPESQRRGVGSLLVRTGIQRAAAAGCEAVLVVGDPAYYARFGFDAALAARFATPYDGPYLLALALAGETPRAGSVTYPRAFAGLG